MFALHTDNIGDLSKIIIKEIEVPKTMSSQDVFVESVAFGFNYDDVAFATDKYPFNYKDKFAKKGNILGLEFVGIIKKVGSKVQNMKVGDRVICAIGNIGNFAEKIVIHSSFLRKIPDEITDLQAVAYGRKGLWVHTLLYRVILIRKKQSVLIHNVSDPLESILCQWANAIGLKTIGTVENEVEVSIAKDIGCDLVVNRKNGNLEEEVRRFTQDKGVNVVYDSVGKGVENISMACMQPFATYIHYFAKNGKAEISADELQKKSLFVTYPTLEQYKGNMQELTVGLDSIFNAIKKGIVRTKFEKLSIANADKAFKAVESGRFKKNIVLVPPNK